MQRREIKTGVVVLGAGVSGLAAARMLAEAGAEVTVVEARDRIGGRIYTRDAEGEPVELGAEFVHGKPAELWRLLEEAGLSTYELDGVQLCRPENGPPGALKECEEEMDDAFEWLEKLKGWREADCSFAEYLELAQVPHKHRQRLVGYVEGFNAADHRVIGVAALGKQQEAEDAIEGDRLFHVQGGYRQLPEYLAEKVAKARGQILLGHTVTAVRWQKGSVIVECEQLRIEARQAVITLPLGVLQSGSVDWSPEPAAILEAARRMRMGQVQRSVLLFDESPVGAALEELHGNVGDAALRKLGFLFAFGQLPPVWWTQYPHKSAMLTGWVGGPRAEGLLRLPEAELERQLLHTLAELLGMDVSLLRSHVKKLYTHDWQADPFARGAYSYVPAGAMGASEAMCEPQHETLFFAGEHTDTTGHWGTVHAALRSGVRAAQQILGSSSSRR